MSKDNKSQSFKIDSTVTTPDGIMTVRGFAFSRESVDTALITKLAKDAGFRVYSSKDINKTNVTETNVTAADDSLVWTDGIYWGN